MVKADLGKKRACLACGMRFYDLNRIRLVSGCGAEFDPENIIKSRKVAQPLRQLRASFKETDDNHISNDDDNELTATVDDDNDDDIDFDSDTGLDVDDDGPGIIQMTLVMKPS